ncbi:MAG: hypothetical protein GXY48_03650 [Methanomicrobiales archaeon]|nr:hypothetical protein [Methanomicrobiales archaeon]
MDLAESILNELVTLQKKNEELVNIITRLEHESDVIIHQFEDKIADLNKKIKKVQDNAAKSEKKFEAQIRDYKKEQEGLLKEKEKTELDLSEKITGLEGLIEEYEKEISTKKNSLRQLTEEKKKLEFLISQYSDSSKEELSRFQNELNKERENAKTEYERLSLEFGKQIDGLNTEITRKDKELRALAAELKNKIAIEQDAIKQEKKNEKILLELHEKLESEQNIRKKIQAEYLADSERMSDTILFLEGKNTDLENTNAGFLQKSNELQEKIQELYLKDTKNQELLSDLKRSNSALQDIIDKNQVELTEKEQNISTLNTRVTDLLLIHDEYEHSISLLHDTIEQNQANISEQDQIITDLNAGLNSLREEMESEISVLMDDNEKKNLALISSEKSVSFLKSELGSVKLEYDERILSLEKTIHDLQTQEKFLRKQAEEHDKVLTNKITLLSSDLEDSRSELINFTQQKDEREQEFRKEIAHLHEELINRADEWKERLESKSRELAERDRHISMISGNNEALRSESERIRSRLLLLEKTIREDNEEPVHALYRQIQDLSVKLANKESENSILSSRIIRLDTENTRLTHILSENCPEPGWKDNSDASGNNQVTTLVSDQKISPELSKYLSNLDDPVQAMQAAADILVLGPQIIDHLIPLLYRGTINRRAWIAVLLYEMNDQRATKPLSDLLDSSESGLRELIWDTRLRFREWRRTGIVSTLAH